MPPLPEPGAGGRRVAYRQKHTSLVAAHPLAHLRNVHRVYDYLARTLDPEAVCALAPAPLVEPPGGPDPDGVADRLIHFLTYAVLAGDPRQIDGVRGFLAGGPPVRRRVRSAVAAALGRHALRVGGLAAEEERRVLDEVSSAVAKQPAPERPALPPHHGRIDLSRVALDTPLPPHGAGARRRALAGQRGLYAGGWLSRPPRLLPPARTGAVLVLRAPGDAPGRDAASVRRRYGATLDLVFGPGLGAPRRLLVTAARVPVVAPCVRAVVVVGNAVPMDAVVAGVPVLVLGDPPPRPLPGGVAFTTSDRLGDAVRAARPAPPVPTPADALDRCLEVVRAHLRA